MSKASKKTAILQVGQANWASEFNMPASLDWQFCHPYQLAEVLEAKATAFADFKRAQKAALEKKEKFSQKPPTMWQMVVVSDVQKLSGLDRLRKMAEPYTLVVASEIKHFPAHLRTLLHDKLAWRRPMTEQADRQKLAEDLAEALYRGQSGLMYDATSLDINPNFHGVINYHGTYGLELIGDFGDDYTPVVQWRKSLFNDPHHTSELWLEYQKDADVNIKLDVRESTAGSIDFQKTYSFDEKEMQHPVKVGLYEPTSFLSMSLRAKGKGKLIIGDFHSRWSRNGFGTLIVGGQKSQNKKRQEFFHYFNPGDMKPPLNVYFAGFRTKQGFEAFSSFHHYGAPFLLLADPRYEGNGFYLGDTEFEAKIQQVIRQALQWLGFNHKQMVMAGISAGTFGALYYSALFRPHAAVGIKPIVNLDQIARNGRLVRPNDFNTIFDIVQSNAGTDEAGLQKMHQHFWDTFKRADLADVDYYFGHMLEDDYDNQTYPMLVKVLAEKGSRLVGKSAHGHHTDGSDVLIPWMFEQLGNIMTNDFQRGKPGE